MSDEPRLVVFETDAGWVGIMHQHRVLQRVRIGFETMLDASLAFQEHHIGPDEPDRWEKKLIQRLTKSLSSTAAKHKNKSEFDFGDIEVENENLTDFQRKVVDACRAIEFGETKSYGELAKQVGHPGAARAVGTVMSKNRFPIIVPCHRVLGTGGLGGYSAPRGLSTKRHLLEIEGHEFA